MYIRVIYDDILVLFNFFPLQTGNYIIIYCEIALTAAGGRNMLNPLQHLKTTHGVSAPFCFVYQKIFNHYLGCY